MGKDRTYPLKALALGCLGAGVYKSYPYVTRDVPLWARPLTVAPAQTRTRRRRSSRR